jgi:hypothetical protein
VDERVVRFAVERPAVRRRVVVFRFAVPRFAVPRFAVLRFAVARFAGLRLAVVRFAVVLRRAVGRFAVVFRPAALVVLRRAVVLRPPPLDDEPLIGEGGGGVGLAGSGVGQTEPGSFCADQSVPSSSCMVPPQISMELSRDAYRIPRGIASTRVTSRKQADENLARQQPAAWREACVTTPHFDEMDRFDLS